jgi:hypothetical protein
MVAVRTPHRMIGTYIAVNTTQDQEIMNKLLPDDRRMECHLLYSFTGSQVVIHHPVALAIKSLTVHHLLLLRVVRRRPALVLEHMQHRRHYHSIDVLSTVPTATMVLLILCLCLLPHQGSFTAPLIVAMSDPIPMCPLLGNES